MDERWEGAREADRPAFEEVQWFLGAPIGKAVVVLETVSAIPIVALLAVYRVSATAWAILIGTYGLTAALLLSMSLRAVVRDGVLLTRFRPFWARAFDLREVENVRTVRFDALGDCGGWGIRLSRKYGWAYIVRGGDGVAFSVGDKNYLVGSQRAPELEAAMLAGGARPAQPEDDPPER